MSKRRIFDIELPADPPAEQPPAPAGAGARRGPMATAIGENAESLRQRAEAEAAIRAENDGLAHEFVRLRRLGLVTDQIPVAEVRTSKLVRDRSQRRDPELDELKASIRELGLSNPIRVEKVDGGYELIQGYRRLSAYRELFEETGDEAWSRIPAGMVAPGETLVDLYRRMVDENLVRRDISFWEMASFVRAYVNEPEIGGNDLDEAVATLFRSANRQKRIYIRHFIVLVAALEKALRWPEAIPRALGLSLVRRMEADPESRGAMTAALRAAQAQSAEDELAVLRRFADGEVARPVPAGTAAGAAPPVPAPVAARRGKTTFRLARPQGEARCTASAGRVELRMDRDFSAIERRRLEAAVDAFFAALDD